MVEKTRKTKKKKHEKKERPIKENTDQVN